MTRSSSARTGVAPLALLIAACSVTRPVSVALDAAAIRSYLSEQPQANLRITEHSGRRYWLHAPAVLGDSLVGQLGFDVPVQRVAVRVGQITELGTTHFSWGRTGALAGGFLAAAFTTLALLVKEAEPLN